MNITSAQYVKNIDDENTSITVILDDNSKMLCVPLKEGNRHYDEIMRQVAAGELTIADAE